MATSNCPRLGPRDSLARDDLVSVPLAHANWAFRVVLAVLFVVLLVIAGSFSRLPSQTLERLVPPGAAPAPAISVGRDDG